MEITNQKWVRRIRVSFMAIGLTVLLTIALLIVGQFFLTAIILAGLFLAVVLVVPLLGLNTIFISLGEGKLSYRYYAIFSLDQEFHMIEFPLHQLYGVEVRRGLLGMRKEIRFSVRINRGIADYPWVNLMGLSKSNKQKLFAFFHNLPTSR